MIMAKVVVGKTSDVQEGKMVHITAGGKEIVVTKLEEIIMQWTIFALMQGQSFMRRIE